MVSTGTESLNRSIKNLGLIVFDRTYGDIAHIHIGSTRYLVVSSPTAIDTVLRERPHVYKRSLGIEKVFKNTKVNGLFSMEGK